MKNVVILHGTSETKESFWFPWLTRELEKLGYSVSFINSDNDPWGCTDIEGRYMLDNIGKGKLIIMKNEGHMGSDTYHQPYRQFPFLLKLIDR